MDERVEYAARVLLAEMRRQFVAAHPGKDVPAMDFDAYSAQHRMALLSGVKRAIVSASPEANIAFENWRQARQSRGEQ